jgi:hypothetical protein
LAEPQTRDPDLAALLKRHADWWQREASLLTRVQGAPLGDLWLPLADGTLAAQDMDVTPELLDMDRLAGEPQPPGALQTWGDRICTADPYSRVPWVEAILGTPVRATIQGGSMRTRACVRSWEEWEGAASHCDAGWFDLLKRLTEMLVERSGGRCAVAPPILRGPCDLAEAVLGPELMCLSMYDHPESLLRFLDEATDTFIAIWRAVTARIPTIEGGAVSPFGIWAPGSVVRTQCDASAFLSAKQYQLWYLPRDIRICEAADYSFIHLHSCSLHVVDALLAVERPRAIQITLESRPKGPSLEDMLPVMRHILAAKPLLLEGPLTEDEVAWLRDHLPAGGLAITARQAEW